MSDERGDKAARRAKIGAAFRELRKRTGFTQAQLNARSGGRLPRGELSKVEQGQTDLSTIPKREALALGYGVAIEVIHGLVDGRLTAETVAKLVAQESPSIPSEVGVPSTGAQGDMVGTFVRIAHVQKSRFPGLEVCILYHEMSSQHGDVPWKPSTVLAARSGDLVAVDRAPSEWKELLDRVDSVVRKAVAEASPGSDGARATKG